MNFKDFIKAPPAEGYLKNSSKLVTALFIIAGVCYYFSKQYGGYAAVICLVIAFMVMFGQKLMLSQITKDFNEMYFAKKQFEETQNLDYIRFIQARATQILVDNKVLSEKAKRELGFLLQYAEGKLKK